MKIIIEKSDNSIYFNYEIESNHFQHILKYPDFTPISDDSICAIAMLSRPINAENYTITGVSPSENQIKKLELCLKSSILANSKSSKNIAKHNKYNYVTAFSGGFDSLALKILIDNDCISASINFGGGFTREYEFFKEETDIIFDWNIRQQKFQNKPFNERLDWRFLISPLALLGSSTIPIAIRTGTIMEASPYWFNTDTNSSFKKYNQAVLGATALHSCPIACLSEYCTTKIIAHTLSAEKLEKSLDSLASKNSFKFHRKNVLLSLAKDYEPDSKPAETQDYKFGSSYSDDMVALYINWKMGSNWTKQNYTVIPSELESLNLSFFEKFNFANLLRVDNHTSQIVQKSLSRFEIKKFESSDYYNLNIAKQRYQELMDL